MPRMSTVPREAKLLAAAMLLIKGLKQADIARALSVSEPTVSQWIEGGRGRFWRVGVHRAGPALASASPTLKRQAEGLLHRPGVSAPELERLAGAQRKHLLSVHVTPTRQRLEEFARLAAPRAHELLSRGKTWGVTSGEHLEALIDALDAGPKSRRRSVQVPLCGNYGGARSAGESSSALAEALERALTGRVTKALNLEMVPAFIPRSLDPAGIKTMWEYIAGSGAYGEIFGTERMPDGLGIIEPRSPALADSLSGLLTGVSQAGEPFGSLRASGGWDRQDIEERYIGTIAGGIGLLRRGATADPKIESLWTGISPESLVGCAGRAAENKRDAVGVVLVASGADRAECVIEAVRAGYVSHLVVDEKLNRDLVRRVSECSWSTRTSAVPRASQ